ncbi:unnamed protein product [Paramecium sonneborni]|uniref:Uncharacterized protein n=1 Tax=Paramecium sonneborni TaxID=65129 RepID=A0A8S1P7D6_9CILI|nr:unnamed protein product [Paramecium sonneborni]
MNHNNDQALIQLSQFKNKQQLLQIDRIILKDCFKGWEHFILLKDFLQNEKNQNLHFTLKAYLQNKFNISCFGHQQNEYIIAIGKIQTFLTQLSQINYQLQQKKIIRNQEQQVNMKGILGKTILRLMRGYHKSHTIHKQIRLFSTQRKQNYQIQQLKQDKIIEFNR